MYISFYILIFLGSVNTNEAKLNTFADVIAVNTSGIQGNYTFHVTIKSPDKGCDQYADWWEVVSTDGVLIYRRILTHSHVDEQPFTRPGGNVKISRDQDVVIRAHVNNTGYGGEAMVGSIKYGFQQKPLEVGFAKLLEKEAPLPEGCAF